MKYLIIFILLFTIAYSKETRIKIGVIDSGVSIPQSRNKFMCKNGRKSLIPSDIGYDTIEHGSSIISLITYKMNSDKYCIISYKVVTSQFAPNMSAYISGLKQAVKDKVKYINISMSGNDINSQELHIIKYALRQGIVIIIAAGNNKTNLDKTCSAFPSCYRTMVPKRYRKNLKIISARLPQSNYGKIGNIITSYELGRKQGFPAITGTSPAAANYTNKIINRKQ